MNGFGIEIKNNLLDPKHVEAIGQAVWLYMWLLDGLTSVSEEGVGLVKGGRPVKYEELKKDLGVSQDTYTRWIDKLVEYPYIDALRTPYGIRFKVFKAHKRFGNRIRKNAEPTSAEPRNLLRKNAESNKTEQVQNSKTGESTPKNPPPSAKEFFDNKELQEKVVVWLTAKGVEETLAREEVKKFVRHWTEPNEKGTKVRWQDERFFDVQRRLTTWFGNVKKWGGARKSFSKVATIS